MPRYWQYTPVLGIWADVDIQGQVDWMRRNKKVFDRISDEMASHVHQSFLGKVKAKIYAISSDTHQLQLTKLHHFKLERFKLI